MINRIVTHTNPHLDELVAVWLLLKFAREIFLGIENASWEQLSVNQMPFSWQEKPNTLFVGCANSPYDEHGLKPAEFSATCSAKLVAEGIFRWVPDNLRFLIDGVTDADRNKKSPTHLGSVIKAMFDLPEMDIWKVYNWLKFFLDKVFKSEKALCKKVDSELTLYQSSRQDFNAKFVSESRPWKNLEFKTVSKFVGDGRWTALGKRALEHRQAVFEQALREIQRNGVTHQFQSIVGPRQLLVIESDNKQISPASRYLDHHICIIKDPKGNVVIMANSSSGLLFYNVIAGIRKREFEKRSVRSNFHWLQLQSEGTLTDCPWWHFHQGTGGMGNIYNGSTSYPDTEPTTIPLQEIVQIVLFQLSADMLKKKDFR
jgi:hypothetical protein